MQTVTNDFISAITSKVRTCRGKVELYTDSTLSNTFNYNDSLQEIEIQRVGTDSKFFGFSICQRLHIKLRDKDRVLTITAGQKLKPYIGVVLEDKTISYIEYPLFRITEVNRNENDNHLEITAYDSLGDTDKLTVADLNLTAPYTIQDFGNAVAAKLGLTIQYIGIPNAILALSYLDGANFNGTETLRSAINAMAEITTSICYVTSNKIVFKALLPNAETDFNITRNDYITLDSGDNRRLTAITHTTELGDNVTASLSVSGTTQIIKENPFVNLRDDAGDIINNMIANIGNLTIDQFECKWRGNPALEIGDKIAFITKDNNTVYAFILDDTITYNVNGLSEKTEWKYEEEKEETESNPTTIDEKLKLTQAKVDKVNQEIQLFVKKDDIITQINLTPGEIKIAGDKISLEGTISANGTFEVDRNGFMTATGGKIAGFTINADSLECDIAEDYSWLTSADETKVQQHILGTGTVTDEEFEKLDVDDSYHLGATDLLHIHEMLNGAEAKTISSKMTINLNSARDSIVLEGLTGFKTGWKTRIGVGGVSTRTVKADTVVCGDSEMSDFVVEQGIEGIWTYKKWASGVAECWGEYTTTVSSWNTWGSVYESQEMYAEYPSELFIEVPQFMASISHGDFGGWIEVYSGASNTRTPVFYVLRSTNNVTGSVSIGMYVIGLWK